MRAASSILFAGLVLACTKPAAEPRADSAAASPPAAPASVAQASSGPGPAVGQVLPPFEAPDQYGRRQTLASLSGPNGLYLNFNRSVVW